MFIKAVQQAHKTVFITLQAHVEAYCLLHKLFVANRKKETSHSYWCSSLHCDATEEEDASLCLFDLMTSSKSLAESLKTKG